MPRKRRRYPPESRSQGVELVREPEPNTRSICNRVRQAGLDECRRADGLTTQERQELS